jgi:putative ABC transport system permease protein
LPAHNTVVSGVWRANDSEGLSIEEGLSKALGVGVGDSLSFEMADQVIKARITSIRRVDWASMHVNFFFIFPRDKMPEGLAQTYISAFRAPDKKGFDRQLVDQFPNVTNIDVGQTIDQVQSVVSQVVQVIEFLFGFTLLAGLLVLLAAVSFNREVRAHDYAVMRALGSGRRQIDRLQQLELVGVGALSGFIASVAAMILGGVLASVVFQFAWTASPVWLFLGTGAGALLSHLAGRWALREVVEQPVVETLRAHSQT